MTRGNLRAQFNQHGKIEVLECNVLEHTEYISRSKYQASSESPEQKPSPNISKSSGKRAAAQQRLNKQSQVAQEQSMQAGPPRPPINRWGVTNAVSNMLEVCFQRILYVVSAYKSKLAETFSQMEHLFQFSQQHPQLTASDALRQLVVYFQNPAQNQTNFNVAMHQQGLINQGQAPAGQRTPGYNGPNQFASPANAHLNLPMNTTSASPATIHMSPAMQNHNLQTHLQQQAPTSVGMVTQQSQQGTNTSVGTGSQATSANASPSVTNKRRRPSGVKMESEDAGGGPEINGTGPKVKPSPRIGGKKQKSGA